ncbi:DUF1292 domain-containing protein [Clostridium algidicarnis]|uniref:UPF0473 protein BD821_101276 n=2 Tax=Clostridium algidicarnis TaxID=37659 RepID=A0A2S6G145_9CLOT|nr:DUF1292 domain-containing protein [Clostridium algidicarnis]MBB6630564.1 DUF1292 domain-containing protein [Clostridium algidicarnis]MBB6696289.1 DUF1292 domain-containing protein [Clostridium algidicarnis]MBU3193508.1 DUF1292 domain-containing protein [Clostridium algidicarnis]MBU3203086.1 DUF1292 domain-containing protein [Clostridium algidicarnis]MBU3205616.1 DUF1292 domain-containing protein [Clostridium algidicarnis]
MEENTDTVVLKDEEGNEIEFEIITKFDIEENEYLIVASMQESETDAIALKILKDSEGNDILVTVDDDEEFEIVAEAYSAIFSEDQLN